jgi:pimeloyl-ACP methyl ester carboxylesterase
MPSDISFRTLPTNGINLKVAEAGKASGGPLVILCHGFPESWYSWRHQLAPIGDAGFHVVAPDMRGYGGSDKPTAIDAYDIIELTNDMSGLIDTLGYDDAIIIGHDWGAPVAWNSALRFPEKISAVGAISIPFTPRGDAPPLDLMKQIFKDQFFYILYFQEAGVAEAELEGDVPRFLRMFMHMGSAAMDLDALATQPKPADAKLLDGLPDPDGVPGFLTQEEFDFYVNEFEANGLSTPLNYYRNVNRSWERTADLAGKLIQQPSMLIVGRQEGVLRMSADPELKNIRDVLPNLKQLTWIENCGHWTQQEKPQEVTDAMVKFLKSL